MLFARLGSCMEIVTFCYRALDGRSDCFFLCAWSCRKWLLNTKYIFIAIRFHFYCTRDYHRWAWILFSFSLNCLLRLQISFGSDNVHLMTFGQPRVGNAAFASYFAKYVPNTIRMTHQRDIVPHLPPYFFFLPQLTYRHFPREVCLCTNLGSVLCWALNIYPVVLICLD
jgi:hypothetical protein